VVKNIGSDQPAGAGCSAAASVISYDANGNVASRTDFNGNRSCYAYDLSRNLGTTRLEGLAPGLSCPADLASYTPANSSDGCRAASRSEMVRDAYPTYFHNTQKFIKLFRDKL